MRNIIRNKSYKYRIYPNKTQETLIQKTFGCARFVYNQLLAKKIEDYENNVKSMSKIDMNNYCNRTLKQEYEWLREVDKFSLTNSLYNLNSAYTNFFRRIKNGDKEKGFPKFKSKKNNRKSYKTNFVNNNIEVLEKYIKLPKLKKVKCKVDRNIEGRIISATISQSPSGKYYVSVCCEVDIQYKTKTNKQVGLDMGISHFCITSDGIKYDNYKYLKKSEKRLAFLQRELSRKSIGSSNRNKTRIKVAKLHEKISNQRKDMLHKISTQIVSDYDVICREDLQVSNMMKNHKLAKSISDVSWYEFFRQLEYKAEWYGKETVKIDKFYPSSQICSNCNVKDGKKELNIREWICKECGSVLDRDINASINILNEGKRLIS